MPSRRSPSPRRGSLGTTPRAARPHASSAHPRRASPRCAESRTALCVPTCRRRARRFVSDSQGWVGVALRAPCRMLLLHVPHLLCRVSLPRRLRLPPVSRARIYRRRPRRITDCTRRRRCRIRADAARRALLLDSRGIALGCVLESAPRVPAFSAESRRHVRRAACVSPASSRANPPFPACARRRRCRIRAVRADAARRGVGVAWDRVGAARWSQRLAPPFLATCVPCNEGYWVALDRRAGRTRLVRARGRRAPSLHRARRRRFRCHASDSGIRDGAKFPPLRAAICGRSVRKSTAHGPPSECRTSDLRRGSDSSVCIGANRTERVMLYVAASCISRARS
ncbi:hypothetical protein B0H15DRAFT_423530 [Mycena belliarum]|uniref:Uncharacterized protein n=1 Tax=Mycena belliarum TaxID=1033014 RepID=A0AAD6TXY6_9AGAR|nr:hypothetical protein B0H15DRAFT_423530 [Mycena belliae]